MPVLKICITCSEWDEGFCIEPASPRYEQVEDGMGTCGHWKPVELIEECQTCRFWVLYRGQRACGNADSSDYALPMKSRECCGDGWQKALEHTTRLIRGTS